MPPAFKTFSKPCSRRIFAAFWARLPETQYKMIGALLSGIRLVACSDKIGQLNGVPGALIHFLASILAVISAGERTSTTTTLGFANAFFYLLRSSDFWGFEEIRQKSKQCSRSWKLAGCNTLRVGSVMNITVSDSKSKCGWQNKETDNQDHKQRIHYEEQVGGCFFWKAWAWSKSSELKNMNILFLQRNMRCFLSFYPSWIVKKPCHKLAWNKRWICIEPRPCSVLLPGGKARTRGRLVVMHLCSSL